MSTLYNYIKTPLGDALLLSDGQYLTGLMFNGQKHMPKISIEWRQEPNLDVFANTELQIREYFNGSRKQFDIAYRTITGTPFQKKVWCAIEKINHGTTVSYKELAKLVGCATSVRAVASAVGKNPLSIIVPCHRIIGSTGDLTGYAGGLSRKSALLTLES